MDDTMTYCSPSLINERGSLVMGGSVVDGADGVG